MGNPNIKMWEIYWEESIDGYIEIACLIKLKGCMLLRHGNVTNVIEMGRNLHTMICQFVK